MGFFFEKCLPSCVAVPRITPATGRQVDAMVYELRPAGVPAGKAEAGYGLMEEEIGVVESV